MSETFNEQKVLFEWEQRFCQKIKPVFKKLGVRWDRIGYNAYREGNDPALPHSFILGWKKGSSKERYQTHVNFNGFDYSDGEHEELDPIIYDLSDDDRNWSQTYRPEAIPVTDVIREKIELHEETHEEYSAEASFSVTNRTTAKASASAEVPGASAEASVENETVTQAAGSFGMSGGERKTRTYTREVETTIHREDLEKARKAGKSLIVMVDVYKRKVVTPVIENGFIECDLEFDLYDWVEENAKYLKGGRDEKHNRIRCSSIQDLIWFLEGERVAEYPGMKDFIGDMKWQVRTKNNKDAQAVLDFLKWIKDKGNRHVSLVKEKVRVYEFAGELTTKFID